MSARYIDIHHHILYGVDDGPQTPRESAQMLRSAVKNGIGAIIATPHVIPGRRAFDRAACRAKIERLNNYAAGHALNIKLYEGAEIFYTDAATRLLDSGKIPTLAGSRCVLVEFNPQTTYKSLFQALLSLGNAGYTPILAHAERYDCLLVRPERAIELKEQLYVLLQTNCAAVLSKPRLGRLRAARFLRYALSEKIVDFVATDAHDTHYRPACMRECHQYLLNACGAPYARRLTMLNAEKRLF